MVENSIYCIHLIYLYTLSDKSLVEMNELIWQINLISNHVPERIIGADLLFMIHNKRNAVKETISLAFIF